MRVAGSHGPAQVTRRPLSKPGAKLNLVRSFGSIVGILIVAANLACAALCGLPETAAPPCHHQQQDDSQPKLCDHHTWAADSAKFIIEAPLATGPLLATRPLPPSELLASLRVITPSPPLILRI